MSKKATINFYARLIRKGQIKEADVPDDIRADVLQKVEEYNSAEKQTEDSPVIRTE